MYVLPFVLILLVALAIFFSPILAVIILAVFLVGLGAYKFFGAGTEPEHAPIPGGGGAPASGEGSDPAPGGTGTLATPSAAESGREESEKTGMWGEQWPERREEEEESKGAG
jgi:hypothetical protein